MPILIEMLTHMKVLLYLRLSTRKLHQNHDNVVRCIADAGNPAFCAHLLIYLKNCILVRTDAILCSVLTALSNIYCIVESVSCYVVLVGAGRAMASGVEQNETLTDGPGDATPPIIAP